MKMKIVDTTVTTLFNEIQHRASKGKEGAIWIRHNQETGQLQLRSGIRLLRILCLRIHLYHGAETYTMNEENFTGELVLDDRGGGNEEARLVLLDEHGQAVLNSDINEINGNLYIAALQDAEKGLALCVSALFRTHAGRNGRSAVMWDNSDKWLFFSDLLYEMMAELRDGKV